MEEIKRWKTIFTDRMSKHPTWKSIKHIQFEDDDLIEISDVDATDEWFIWVKREVEETADEYKERMLRKEYLEKYQKQQRYETYLELKKEFDNGKI
jgi:hypothetical protein